MDNKQVFKNINKNTKAILMSHIQGFNGFTNELLKSINKNKIFDEDVCESHGAKFKRSKSDHLEMFLIFHFITLII